MTTTSPATIRLRADRLVAGGLRVEDARRPAMVPPLVAGQLDDAAVRRQRAAQDRQAAGRLDAVVSIGTTTSWPGVSDGGGGDLGDRPAVDGLRVAVEQVRASGARA